MGRYFRLFATQVRYSLTVAAQYRLDFLIEALLSVFTAATAIVPLFVVFKSGRTVAGWSWQEALVVFGWFVFLKAVLEGAITPSLTAVVDHIRKGTLDFVLLKPADAQFLVSTAKFEPQRIVDATAAIGVLVWALRALGHVPTLAEISTSFLMLIAALLVLYSLWILVVSVAFIAVRVDNLSFFFSSLFDAARWPSSVFRGAWRIVFTFVVPLALMTTVPAQALLGKLSFGTAALSITGALLFAATARAIWIVAIGKYTSAGG